MTATVKKIRGGIQVSCDECPRWIGNVYTGPLVEGRSILQRQADDHNGARHATKVQAETVTDFQSIRGACPATGRSAGVCADQSHVDCYGSNTESQALDLKVEREHARLDPSY